MDRETTRFGSLSFAEHAILLVKTRLFRLLRTLMTRNWPKYLNQVVTAINKSPNSAIGGLAPARIQSREDGTIIDEKIGYNKDTPPEIQNRNQKNYEKGKGRSDRIQVGNYVYLDFNPSTMDKSFDTKRNEIYRVIRVDAGKDPPLYKLADLMKQPLEDYYYADQLMKTTKPKRSEYFAVEKIVGQKTFRGKEYVKVKYLHYKDKFNRWIPKENMLKGYK